MGGLDQIWVRLDEIQAKSAEINLVSTNLGGVFGQCWGVIDLLWGAFAQVCICCWTPTCLGVAGIGTPPQKPGCLTACDGEERKRVINWRIRARTLPCKGPHSERLAPGRRHRETSAPTNRCRRWRTGGQKLAGQGPPTRAPPSPKSPLHGGLPDEARLAASPGVPVLCRTRPVGAEDGRQTAPRPKLSSGWLRPTSEWFRSLLHRAGFDVQLMRLRGGPKRT